MNDPGTVTSSDPQFPMDLNSDINAYVPPVVGPRPDDVAKPPRPKFSLEEVQVANSKPVVMPQQPPALDPALAPAPAETTQSPSPVLPQPIARSLGQEPAVMPAVSTSSVATAQDLSSDEQKLEDQNIFDLLGVVDASEEEKEKFLDELQQVIWDDFLENDVKLLLTDDEYAQVKAIKEEADLSEADKQEKLVVYLEKLVPDLEKIMLEKAMELKEDMVKERLQGMKSYFSQDQTKMATLNRATTAIEAERWKETADILNSLQE